MSIDSAESRLTIFYAVKPSDGNRYVYVVTLLNPETGYRVIRGASEDYALVTPLSPRGYSYWFLRGVYSDWRYVAEKTGLPEYPAKVLAWAMPKLTRMLPPEEIEAAFEEGVRRAKLEGEEFIQMVTEEGKREI